jgi:hypothetical protein
MTVTVAHITFDAADAAALAEFWSGVLERPVDEGATDGFATIGMSGAEPMRPVFMFIQVPEPRTGKNRIHVDLHATDPQAAVDRVVALGATKVGEFDEYGTAWTTLADSEGNLFDISGAEE